MAVLGGVLIQRCYCRRTRAARFVLDNFAGAGSTILAAERVGRVCYAIEIDPLYVDTAVRRWEKQSGEKAVCAATGKHFDKVGVPNGK